MSFEFHNPMKSDRKEPVSPPPSNNADSIGVSFSELEFDLNKFTQGTSRFSASECSEIVQLANLKLEQFLDHLNQEDSSIFPVRITVMTFNVWGDHLLTERLEVLSTLITNARPDILLLQELTPDIVDLLHKILSDYDRIVDPSRIGYLCEGNIFWNRKLFRLVASGAESLEAPGYPNRDFVWARLRIRANNQPLFVSTAHLPWAGCPAEIETGVNQRVVAMRRICRHLTRLPQPNEPIIFGGDFNEDFHPLRVLVEETGMVDVFESLDLPPPITHPVRPSSPQEEQRPNRTLDWITCFLPSHCRVVGAFVKAIRGGCFPPPSDHLPVMAIFEIAGTSPSEEGEVESSEDRYSGVSRSSGASNKPYH